MQRGSKKPRRKRLLTLGGCNTLETGKKLAWLYDHDHSWSVTWPSLGSPPFQLTKSLDDPVFDTVRNFVERDGNKSDRDRIAKGKYDIILTTSQFTHIPFVLSGAACIADFTDPIFLRPEVLGDRVRPNVLDFAGPDARVVTWEDAEYEELVVGGFRTAYETAFLPAIRSGAMVVVYDHVLSLTELKADGEVPIEREGIDRRIALNRSIVEQIQDLPGIKLLATEPAFSATAADAPWGNWEYHPMEEQYVDLAIRLARMAGDDAGREILARHMIAMRKLALGNSLALQAEAEHRAGEERRAAAAETAARALQADIDAMRRTLSWRVTAPLRAFRRLTRRPSAAKAP